MVDLEWLVPRCEHGHIILACPDDTCCGQGTYLADQRAAMDRYEQHLVDDVRAAFGLPATSRNPRGEP